jgi:hypothetical protein
MNRWLNFREIKQSIPIEAVLEHYQWKYLRRRGDRVQGCCFWQLKLAHFGNLIWPTRG